MFFIEIIAVKIIAVPKKWWKVNFDKNFGVALWASEALKFGIKQVDN